MKFYVEDKVLDIGVKIVEQTTGYCGGTGEIIIPKIITVTEEKK